MGLSIGDDTERGQISFMVQDQMQLDGSLGPTELRSIKKAHAQVDHGRSLTSLFLNRNLPAEGPAVRQRSNSKKNTLWCYSGIPRGDL